MGVVRIRGLGRAVLARDARGGKADQALGADDGLEVLEDDLLDGQVLGGCLEHVVAVFQILELEGGHQALVDCGSRLRGQLATSQTLLDVAADAFCTGVQGLFLDVVEIDLAATRLGEG